MKMTSVNAICNNKGTIDEMTVATGSYSNDGYTGTLTLDAVTNVGSAVVYMNSGSLIDTLTYTPITESGDVKCKIKIDASKGAKIQSLADVCSDYLASNSSGTILVGSTGTDVSGCLLKLNGNNAFPSGLKFEVASVDTMINNNMSSSAGVCSVVCEGKTYPLPASSQASISTLYGTLVSQDEISFADLTAGYGTGDVEEKVISVSLTGGTEAGKMNCRITHMPEFIELRDESGTPLVEGDNVTLENVDDSPEKFTVRAKIGNAAAEYNDTLEFALETNIENAQDNGISNIVVREVSIPISLSVARKTGSGSIKVADIYYGESIDPVVTSTANGTENVTIEYKTKGAGDSTYTTVKPTQAGSYTARATFPETDTYEKAIATCNFSIKKKTGSGTIEVADIYYGGAIQPVVTSDANGIEDVTIEYKAKGADDSSYTTVKPMQAGSYTVRATFAETKEYLAATATDDFTITYLATPKRPYELQGTMGENHYYTSNVTIIPAEGYLIADSFDGEYKKELTVDQSSTGLMIYLQNIATGGITEGIAVADFLIDRKAPVVSKAVSGETIYGDEAEIIVKDDNLSEVLVNGERVEIKNNQAILQLASNGGEEKYEIVSTDIAGNQSKIQITVAAEWMKKKIIPSGVKVRLSQECAYTLGSGTWKVSGDGTEYSGGNTFYVRSDGEYSFTKTN